MLTKSDSINVLYTSHSNFSLQLMVLLVYSIYLKSLFHNSMLYPGSWPSRSILSVYLLVKKQIFSSAHGIRSQKLPTKSGYKNGLQSGIFCKLHKLLATYGFSI